MASEMRVHESSNPVETFMKQMIPHHANAVNMAKALLKNQQRDVKNNVLNKKMNKTTGRSARLGYTEAVEALLRNILATQNSQIQEMRDWLGEYASDSPPITCPPKSAVAASGSRAK